MNKNTIKTFIYGTQYYRAPTPLPEEWEYDLRNMEKIGLQAIQLRVQWRWNEPEEGKYLFEDIDRLFDLAEKYRKKVIFKFLMECAPDYIFYKYQGYRKDMHGLPMNPGAHGAFYVGGWLPCFDNPDVIRKAEDFVRIFVDRYKERENLLLWNIWNEPRSRPIGECGCQYSIKAYREWLKEKYKTIETLNNKFGKRWESFDTIMPPSMPHDYAELFLWRKWALSAVKKRLQFMYKAVRDVDPTTPITTHVGACNVIQDIAGDGSDDLENATVVDFYGTSLPSEAHITDIIDESQLLMTCDWLRSVSEYYWVNELYPDWGNWNRKATVEDLRFKVWSTIACGAKGLLYWQFRAERLGNENNLSGLVNIDGSFKDITYEARRISKIIKTHGNLLLQAKVKEDEVGILYSLESDLINRIENTGGSTRWSFELKGGYPYGYKKALIGIYTLFRELGFTIQWIDTRKLKEKIKSVRLLYIPECFIISEENIELIEDFVKKGGYVIAEEGIGLRKENTWLNLEWPMKRVSKLFGAKIEERISAEKVADYLTLFGTTIPPGGYISYLNIKEADAIGYWQDKRIGASWKGKLFYIGTSLGISFYENFQKNYPQYLKILSHILRLCNIKPVNSLEVNRLYMRRLFWKNKNMVFVFNRTDSKQTIKLDSKVTKIQKITDSLLVEEGDKNIQVKILPQDVGVYLYEEDKEVSKW